MENVYIGIDFSINKPAATILYNGEYTFMTWPLDLSKKLVELYQEHDVKVTARGLSEISKKSLSSTKLTMEHTKRSIELAEMIINDIKSYITDKLESEEYQLYIATEGLSFGSSGNASMDLATYKGVFLAELYKHLKDKITGLYTYPPISLKSTAGCATKDKIKNKDSVVEAFRDSGPETTLFVQGIRDVKFKAKTHYVKCVDDIVDSYYALQTMIKKEGLF